MAKFPSRIARISRHLPVSASKVADTALCIISAAIGALAAAATLTRIADKALATHGLLRLH